LKRFSQSETQAKVESERAIERGRGIERVVQGETGGRRWLGNGRERERVRERRRKQKKK
jgi:hypothetical protein